MLGFGLFFATIILVLKGGPNAGQHLRLLRVFLPGYSVSFAGSLIGFVYMFVFGYAIGRLIGSVYNWMVAPSDSAEPPEKPAVDVDTFRSCAALLPGTASPGIRDWIRLLRPAQWTKNLFVMAPLLFSGKGSQSEAIVSALLALVTFCLLASAVYSFNDVADRESDRSHQPSQEIARWRAAASPRPPRSGCPSCWSCWAWDFPGL